jgi:hypothetical protein
MIITSQNITKALVDLVERERQILIDIQKINERYETAANLQNMNEIEAIEKEGKILEKRQMHHLGAKAMIMSFAISLNKGFQFN